MDINSLAPKNNYDVIILGAGASGLMCAIEAAQRGRRVLVLDHANKAGKKIRISGGGKANFTNLDVQPQHYLSNNAHFCKSALSRFNNWDFIEKINQAKITYEERDHGRLFTKETASLIVGMLLNECKKFGALVQLDTLIHKVEIPKNGIGIIETSKGIYDCQSLVVATGALSFPGTGATALGYEVAKKAGIPIVNTQPALVPITASKAEISRLEPLSGIALLACVSNSRNAFTENLLFTHRGLSGPAILQISSYWELGESININLLPEQDLFTILKSQRMLRSQKNLQTFLGELFPKRLVQVFLRSDFLGTKLADCSDAILIEVAQAFQQWVFTPVGSMGYAKAEVTRGGVDCDFISSKTLETKQCKGLYFVGEVLDVTGQLGGYNLQWAWASGWCAGQYV
jgi:predicted Rossmann fold flavoprotein